MTDSTTQPTDTARANREITEERRAAIQAKAMRSQNLPHMFLRRDYQELQVDLLDLLAERERLLAEVERLRAENADWEAFILGVNRAYQDNYDDPQGVIEALKKMKSQMAQNALKMPGDAPCPGDL